LESFPFNEVNVIVNHDSVTLDDFPGAFLKGKVKLWNNVLRHNDSRGPITKSINQAYIHTFLSGKKYCIVAHDNMEISKGWDEIVRNTDYDLYMAPEGDEVHIQTLNGFKIFGWWDERYSTMGWHEIDYICRAYRKCVFDGVGKASIFDLHGGFPENHFKDRVNYNSVGLENYFRRADKGKLKQIGERKNSFFVEEANRWNNKKWRNSAPWTPENVLMGPAEEEINWYPWLNRETLETDGCSIQ